jgi:TonB family protein
LTGDFFERVLRLACLAMLASSAAVRADADPAPAALATKDAPPAFEDFRRLAELGNRDAQENLAVMYVNGEGVTRDNVLGYAWASLALEQAESETARGIVKQLDPHMTDGARQRVAAVRDQFGHAALEKHLLPVPRQSYEDPGCTFRVPANPVDHYPKEAIHDRKTGQVFIEFAVMPDGRARNPRVIYGIPANVFNEAARQVVLGSSFVPKRENGVAVKCTMRIMVKFLMAGGGGGDDLKTKMSGTRTSATGGDAHSQFVYGLVLSSRPDLNPQGEPAMPWFVKAAQGGHLSAQFIVGAYTLGGIGVERDPVKGERWLEMAAAGGQTNAQVALANHLMGRDTDPARVGRAIDLLERAAAAGNRDAGFYLAALLAAGPDAAKRDAKRALSLLSEVMTDVNTDPTAFEIRAAARAALGDFDAAQKDQKKAVNLARRARWDRAPLEARLARYTAGEAWSGELFEY